MQKVKSFVPDKRNNVLLVVRWPVGGIRTFIKYLISYFPSSNYRFFLVGMFTEGMEALRSELGDRIENWFLIPPGDSEVIKLAFTVWKLNRLYEFDVIHAHGFTSVACCLLTSLKSDTRLICTSHDVLNRKQFNRVRGLIRKFVLARALARCNVVHSVSTDAESNLLSFFPSIANKSIVIENGIDSHLFTNSEKKDLHLELGIDPSVKIIGFFGRFMSQKGFKHLVSAIDYLRKNKDSADIHVVCYGSGAFIREEQCEIKRGGLESYFTFVPFTPDVSGAMKGCDVVAMPSLWEACGLVAMEALVTGVPIVGTNCIGLREVLEGTPAVKTVAGDSISLAQGILQSIEMGRKPFESFAPVAADRFDVRKTAVSIYEVYERMVR